MPKLSDDTKKEICNSLKTNERVQSFLDTVDSLLDVFDSPKKDINTVLSENDHTPLISTILDKSEINSKNINHSDVKSLFKQVREYLLNLPNLELELPVEPTKELTDTIYEWFKNNKFGNFIMHVSLHPEIGAGLNVIWQGRFINLSLATVLENYFNEKKDVIEGILYQ